jgi:NTE family protein
MGKWRIFNGDKVINTLVDLLEDIQIEDLPIPFTAVAADIIHREGSMDKHWLPV